MNKSAKGKTPAEPTNEQLIEEIMILQRNIAVFKQDLVKEEEANTKMKKDFKQATGQNINLNPRRFDKLPEQLKEAKKSGKDQKLYDNLREAYA
jgi:hypothetical protein